MKKFSFSMEKVLKLREYREQETKLELGRTIGELSEIENNIKAVANERIRSAALQFLPENGVMEIIQYSMYIARLDYTKENLLKDAAMAEIKVEQAREIYIDASKGRKVLDKIKEKQKAEYKRQYAIEETKLLDDLASGAQIRRLAG